MTELFKFTNQEVWLKALVDQFLNLVHTGIAVRGRAHVALAGGSTPQPFYRRLSENSKVPWSKMEWWMSDERWVSALDSLSNECMIRNCFAAAPASFEAHFHSPRLALEPAQAAERYQKQIQQCLGVRPMFDLILLGLGEDGHTASLFPETQALSELHQCVVANHVPQANQSPVRITFTFPILHLARQIWFLVSGVEKRERVSQVLARDSTIPAARIDNPNQKIFWLSA